jgi:hypothetical protein
MSFDLRLDLPCLDAGSLVRLTRDVNEHGAWPLAGGDRPYLLEDDGDLELFTHVEQLDSRFVWQSPPGVGERLARTFLLLAQAADEFSFHAAWGSAQPNREVTVSAEDVADLARRNRLDEDTLYRVAASR